MKVTWAEGPHPPVRKELVVWRSCVQLQWYVFHRPSVSLSHALCSWLLGFQCAVGRCVGVEHPYVKESTFLLTSCSRTLELRHLAEHCLLCLVSFSGMFHQIGIEVLALFSHSHKLLSAAGLRFWMWSWWVEGNAPLEQLNACVVEENGAAQEQWVSSLVVSPDCCWVGISRRHNGHSLQLCHFSFNSFAYKWKVEIPSSCLYYYNVPLHWYYNSASESFLSYQVYTSVCFSCFLPLIILVPSFLRGIQYMCIQWSTNALHVRIYCRLRSKYFLAIVVYSESSLNISMEK